MFVDDHQLLASGSSSSLSIRLSKPEIALLIEGRALTGSNLKGRGVRILLESGPLRRFVEHQEGYLELILDAQALEALYDGAQLILSLASSTLTDVILISQDCVGLPLDIS